VGREGGREGGRDGGMEGWRDGGRERERERERERGREREREREGERERERERERKRKRERDVVCCFTYRSSLSIEALGGNGVDLVDEDDGGRVFARQAENVTHHPWTLPEILLDELRARGSGRGREGGKEGGREGGKIRCKEGSVGGGRGKRQLNDSTGNAEPPPPPPPKKTLPSLPPSLPPCSPHDGNEGGGSGLCHRLRHHRLARPGRSVHKHAPRRIDTDLLVELKMGQGKLHRLLYLLRGRKRGGREREGNGRRGKGINGGVDRQ